MMATSDNHLERQMRKAALMLHHASEGKPSRHMDTEHRRAMAEALEILARELRQMNVTDPVVEGEIVE